VLAKIPDKCKISWAGDLSSYGYGSVFDAGLRFFCVITTHDSV
jgi:hypothetical protein